MAHVAARSASPQDVRNPAPQASPDASGDDSLDLSRAATTDASASEAPRDKPYEQPSPSPDAPPAQPPDQPLDRPLDSEETEVLRIDPAIAGDAPPTPATTDPAHDDADGPRSTGVPSVRTPEARQDTEWRPKLLPRDERGRPVVGADEALKAGETSPGGTTGADPWSALPDDGTALRPSAPTPPPGSSAVPRPRTLARPRSGFDPMSMVAGFFFMGIAVTYLLDAGDAVDARPGIMLALAVIGVGASGFVGAVWAMITSRRAKRAARRPGTGKTVADPLN
ncbi:hypothetical protein [Yinghuangia sp. YIM S10712]|uniref:hypothetical protein n=1 Tax=Yinghuangia sp. YIM S10712 TaxID=3436930 RepID=UPI003F53A65E